MFRTTTRGRAIRRPMMSERFHVVALAATLLGAQLFPSDSMAGAPEASGPVCVPVPGMPCPGTVRSSSSSTSRSTYSSGKRSSKPSTNSIMFKELQSSIDQMTTPNPTALQRIRQTQMEGNRAQEEAVTSQQATEEQRLQKALSHAEAARMKQIQDLTGSLQGLPGSAPIEKLRAAGSSGFDTRGPLSGQILPPPPPASPPTPVVLQEKAVPPEKVTPEMQALLKEREELRGRKKEMQESLERFESKGNLMPEESAAIAKLRKDLAVTLNKEDYLTFSINESLP